MISVKSVVAALVTLTTGFQTPGHTAAPVPPIAVAAPVPFNVGERFDFHRLRQIDARTHHSLLPGRRVESQDAVEIAQAAIDVLLPLGDA